MMLVPMSFLLRVPKSHILIIGVVLGKSRDKKATPRLAVIVEPNESKDGGFVYN